MSSELSNAEPHQPLLTLVAAMQGGWQPHRRGSMFASFLLTSNPVPTASCKVRAQLPVSMCTANQLPS
jgi:hypothetical protein